MESIHEATAARLRRRGWRLAAKADRPDEGEELVATWQATMAQLLFTLADQKDKL